MGEAEWECELTPPVWFSSLISLAISSQLFGIFRLRQEVSQSITEERNWKVYFNNLTMHVTMGNMLSFFFCFVFKLAIFQEIIQSYNTVFISVSDYFSAWSMVYLVCLLCLRIMEWSTQSCCYFKGCLYWNDKKYTTVVVCGHAWFYIYMYIYIIDFEY